VLPELLKMSAFYSGLSFLWFEKRHTCSGRKWWSIGQYKPILGYVWYQTVNI